MFAFQHNFVLANDSINADFTIPPPDLNYSFFENDCPLNFEDNDIELKSSSLDLNPLDLEKQKTSQNTYLLNKRKRDNFEKNNFFMEKDSYLDQKFEKINMEEQPINIEGRKIKETHISEKKINSFENLQNININELSENYTVKQKEKLK